MDPVELAKSMVSGGNFDGATANALIAIAENTGDLCGILACIDERLEYLECLEFLYRPEAEEEDEE